MPEQFTPDAFWTGLQTPPMEERADNPYEWFENPDIPRLRADYVNRQMEQAREYWTEHNQDTDVAVARGIGYVAQRIPFVRLGFGTVNNMMIANAQRRIREGREEQGDFDLLARRDIDIENRSQYSTLENINDLVSSIPAFGVEMATTYGAYQGGARLGQAILPGAAGRGLGMATGAGAAALATGGMVPEAVTGRMIARGNEEQRSLWQALGPGAFDAWTEMFTERLGGTALFQSISRAPRAIINRIGLGRATDAIERGVLQRWNRLIGGGAGTSQLAQHMGWDGIISEMLEERAGELMRGAVLGDDYGATGMLARGDFAGFGRQMMVEGTAFAIFGLGARGFSDLRAADTLPRRGSREYGLHQQALAFQLADLPNQVRPDQLQEALANLQPAMDHYGVTAENAANFLPEPAQQPAQEPQPGLEAMPEGVQEARQGVATVETGQEPSEPAPTAPGPRAVVPGAAQTTPTGETAVPPAPTPPTRPGATPGAAAAVQTPTPTAQQSFRPSPKRQRVQDALRQTGYTSSDIYGKRDKEGNQTRAPMGEAKEVDNLLGNSVVKNGKLPPLFNGTSLAFAWDKLISQGMKPDLSTLAQARFMAAGIDANPNFLDDVVKWGMAQAEKAKAKETAQRAPTPTPAAPGRALTTTGQLVPISKSRGLIEHGGRVDAEIKQAYQMARGFMRGQNEDYDPALFFESMITHYVQMHPHDSFLYPNAQGTWSSRPSDVRYESLEKAIDYWQRSNFGETGQKPEKEAWDPDPTTLRIIRQDGTVEVRQPPLAAIEALVRWSGMESVQKWEKYVRDEEVHLDPNLLDYARSFVEQQSAGQTTAPGEAAAPVGAQVTPGVAAPAVTPEAPIQPSAPDIEKKINDAGYRARWNAMLAEGKAAGLDMPTWQATAEDLLDKTNMGMADYNRLYNAMLDVLRSHQKPLSRRGVETQIERAQSKGRDITAIKAYDAVPSELDGDMKEVFFGMTGADRNDPTGNGKATWDILTGGRKELLSKIDAYQSVLDDYNTLRQEFPDVDATEIARAFATGEVPGQEALPGGREEQSYQEEGGVRDEDITFNPAEIERQAQEERRPLTEPPPGQAAAPSPMPEDIRQQFADMEKAGASPDMLSALRGFFTDDAGTLWIPQGLVDGYMRLQNRAAAAVKGWKSRGAAVPPLVVDTTNRVPRPQNWNEEKQIASQPRGLGRIPFLGWMLDPRARADSPMAKALIARDAAIEKGKALAGLELMRQVAIGADKLFAVDEATGSFPLTDGTPGFLSDVVTGEMAKPKSQKITDQQRSWIVSEWIPVWRSAMEYRLAQGITTFTDPDTDETMSIDDLLKKGYFPRDPISKRNREVRPGGPITTKARPGAKTSQEKARVYETEQEGATGIRKDGSIGEEIIIYRPLASGRVGKFLMDHYRILADHSLAADPALEGKFPHERYLLLFQQQQHRLIGATQDQRIAILREWDAKSKAPIWGKEEAIQGPAFAGKFYPKEVVDTITTRFGHEAWAWVKAMENITASAKANLLILDASIPLTLGLPLMFTNPTIWSQATANHFHAMTSPEFMAKWLTAHAEAANELVQGGESLATYSDFLKGAQEGTFISKIPVYGRAVKATGRGALAFLDTAKILRWEVLRQITPKEQWATAMESLGGSVGMGRMESIGITPAAATLERLLFLAPMYLRSNVSMIATMFQGGMAGKIAMKNIGGLAAGTILTAIGGMLLAGLSWDEIRKRLNPANSKFLKVPVKLSDGLVIETGFSHGVISLVQLLARTAGLGDSNKPISTGIEGNPLVRWFYGKSALVPGLAADLFTGRDYLGNELPLHAAVARRFAPIVIGQILFGEDAVFPGGVGSARVPKLSTVPEALFSFFGMSSYPQNQHTVEQARLGRISQERFGRPYGDLTLVQQVQAARELARTAPSKEPSSPLQIARFAQASRHREQQLMAGLTSDNRSRLAELQHELPSYHHSLQIQGVRIPLTDRSASRYQALLIEEYNRVIGAWNMAALRNTDRTRLETYMRRQLMHAKERAQARLTREAR